MHPGTISTILRYISSVCLVTFLTLPSNQSDRGSSDHSPAQESSAAVFISDAFTVCGEATFTFICFLTALKRMCCTYRPECDRLRLSPFCDSVFPNPVVILFCSGISYDLLPSGVFGKNFGSS